MASLFRLLAGASLLATAFSQQSNYVAPGVPVGTPIPGNYSGGLRPQLHFSPPQHFMNDPNGMFVDADGLYHLYYQYNPITNVAGNQHWGHATSRDLYHWENRPIAIFPDTNTTYVYSGSAVVDVNNTSGFFPNQTNGVVAIYTLAEYTTKPGPQTQNIAYSTDGGYTFTKYSGNPVIDINSTQFRDPKVVWHAETQRWAMVLAYASEFTVGIYTSPNLREWTHASNFSHHGLLGIQYECPNMVQMPFEYNGTTAQMWLMVVSINPGAPLGGSATEYFPGQFNGTHFTAVDPVARLADFGKDNYAGQFFYGVPGDQPQVFMGWANNWQYTQQTPTGPAENWRSAMTLPRYMYLTNLTGIGYDLVSTPYELTPQIGSELASNSSLGNGTVLLDYSQVESGALYFEANVTGLTSSTLGGGVNFTFLSSVSGESIRGATNVGGDTWINRQHIRGFDNPYFTDKFSVSGVFNGESWSISGVIDRSILEVFINGGEQSGTFVFYPTQPLDQMSIRASGISPNATLSAAVWGLDSAWAQYEDESGTVVGNVTSGGGNRTAVRRRAPLYRANFG